MPTTHAEINAYTKIKGCKNIPKKLDLFVIRITKGGNLAESRPCLHCINILSKSYLNLINVYYSTADGIIVCETFKSLINDTSCHITGGFLRHK